MPAELKAYHPSARERTEQFLRDLLAGGTRPSAVQASQVRGIMNALDFTPAGLLFGAYEAGRMLGAGIAKASPWQIAGGTALAALTAVPLAAKAFRSPVARAWENARLYDPPPKLPREFALDYPEYPWATPAHVKGRLSYDMEGRPLTARWVVGRNVLGGHDEAFPAAELDALATATTGRPAKNFSPRKMGGNLGRVLLSQIDLRSDLGPFERPRVYGHELGHVIDKLAGRISTKNLSEELRRVYNALNNPQRDRIGGDTYSWVKPVTPEDFGYTAEEAPFEYMAEAIRAYLFDPNYIKTVAPKTAKAIRAAVNADARLAQIIQFNSALAPVATADVLSPPDGGKRQDARKKLTGNTRVDPSDPSATNGLSTERWMKLRGEQERQPR